MNAPNQSMLSDQLACLNTLYRSYRFIDHGRASEATALFIDEGRFCLEGVFDVRGKADLAHLFEARQADNQRLTRHTVTNPLFSLIDDSTATIHAILNLYVKTAGQAQPEGIIDIADRYRKEEGTWKIEERVLSRPAVKD